MIVVGILRWIFDYRREEIQILLSSRGIEISTGEISNLSEEFLLRFYALHKRHIPQMKELFDKDGGSILHLDGSGEAGDPIVFTAIEGKSGITIDSQTIPSESKIFVKAFLEQMKAEIGTPLVVVRDMSKEIASAVSEIFPLTPQQICHYHFVCNLGKIVFRDRYASFRKALIGTRVPAQLKTQLKALGMAEDAGAEDAIIAAERKWVEIAIEYLLWPRERPSDFPFILPYVDVMDRILEVRDMVVKVSEWNCRHGTSVSAVLDTLKRLTRLEERADITAMYIQMKKIWCWFEDLRRGLAVSRELSGNGERAKPISGQATREILQDILIKIEEEGREMGGELQMASSQIIGNVKSHWDELSVDVKDSDGNEVEIVRTNGIEERSHRWSRMHTRRRTGRSRTTMEMMRYGALMAILSNLKIPVYVKEVLRDVDDLVREMQNITTEEVDKAKRLIRAYESRPSIRIDDRSFTILQDFVDRLKRSGNGERIAKEWLSKVSNPTPK
jgi:MULE transposase domain.